MLDKLLDFSKLGGDYTKFCEDARNKVPCSVFGMTQTEKILSSVALKSPIVYLTSDIINARRAFEVFSQVVGDSVTLFSPGSDVLVYKKVQSNDNNLDRIKTIFRLCENNNNIIVCPIESLLGYLPNKEDFKKHIIYIKKGDDIEIKLLREKLISSGYKEESLIDSPGKFSVRGDIFDVFPINSDTAFRIEFFDTEVESIKELNVATQTSKKEINDISICPFINLFLSGEERASLILKLENIAKKFNRQETISSIIEKLEIGDIDFSLDFLFPLVEDKLSTLFDYLPENTVFVIDECKMVFDGLNASFSEIDLRYKMLEKSGEVLSKNTGYLSKQAVLDKINTFSRVAHQKITTQNNFFKPQAVFSFKSEPVARYSYNIKELASDVEDWLSHGMTVLIMCSEEKMAKSLQKNLENYDVFIDINPHANISSNYSALLPYELSTGFMIPSRKLVVLGTYDVFPKKQATKHVNLARQDVFSVPKVGDYVVHSVHGIGMCEGVSKLTGNFGTKDYIVVRYFGNDRLYVPIDQMDLLDRFSGAETPKKLSKIGGVEFGKVKDKVKASVKKMAIDLLELYAKRDAKKGFVYSKDSLAQKEFENSFPYVETEDQLTSLSEIKKDMESGKVMDRLLCGDVGFGKTEVALRCAFKAILDGKQVAFIAPTTILSEQHFNTVVSRMNSFGVKAGCLNRFNSTKEKKEVLSGIKDGTIDIVCGTHRLLSKDVEFKNLGLVIVDEEQKFGVEDKEKIKLGNENVDILTLSATPIPRTLNMSLAGIRDISIIQTPPSERLPVQTYVTEYTETLVKDAIEREINRGGQVFFVYNRVENIYAFTEKLKKIVPTAKFLVAHGQLDGNVLEDVIYQFYNKMADVLVCSTIIENGIDVGNANTLIVYDADKFGLSQLYQIRGRVGRSNRTAYAYFTYNYDKVLSEDAYKRLEAISEFTEFGSGFKVAMRDLEIRGSGNLLGAEQHGHMQKVGYDMYCKLLNEAVAELKGKKIEEEKTVQIKIELDAFISENYIRDSESRMKVYKNISRIDSLESANKLTTEIEDMFGEMPLPTKNLIEIALIRSLAKTVGITEIVSAKGEIRFGIENNTGLLANSWFANAVYKYRDMCTLDMSGTGCVKFNTKGKNNQENLEIIKSFLMIATNLV